MFPVHSGSVHQCSIVRLPHVKFHWKLFKACGYFFCLGLNTTGDPKKSWSCEEEKIGWNSAARKYRYVRWKKAFGRRERAHKNHGKPYKGTGGEAWRDTDKEWAAAGPFVWEVWLVISVMFLLSENFLGASFSTLQWLRTADLGKRVTGNPPSHRICWPIVLCMGTSIRSSGLINRISTYIAQPLNSLTLTL